MHLYITVKITAALDGNMLNQHSVDRDPQISIADGRVVNEYQNPFKQVQFQTSSHSSSNQPRGLGLASQLRMVDMSMWQNSTVS